MARRTHGFNDGKSRNRAVGGGRLRIGVVFLRDRR